MKKILIMLVLAIGGLLGFQSTTSAAQTEAEVPWNEIACVEVGLTELQAVKVASLIVSAIVEKNLPVGAVFYRNSRSCDDEGSEIPPVMEFGRIEEGLEHLKVEMSFISGACALDFGSIDLYGINEADLETAKDLVIEVARRVAIEMGLYRPEKG